jgi:hypothetical protein
MTTEQERDDNIEKTALEHTWEWFSLHATQRLQSVNFFLIAMAFLSAAFVTAAKEKMYVVAGGVAILATSVSYFFYRLERRIRSLVKAAEAAMLPLEDKLANALNVDALRIVSLVEDGRIGEWKYSKVFRYLYLASGIAFVLGLLYVSWAAFSETPGTAAFNVVVQAVLGVFLMLCGYEMLFSVPRSPNADQVRATTRWILLALGVVCIVVGIVVICHLVFLRLPVACHIS